MDIDDSKSEKRNIGKRVYIALGCLFLVFIVAVTVFSLTLQGNRLPLAEVYIVGEDGRNSIDYTYRSVGVIENGKLIVTVDFTLNFSDVFLINAIPPGTVASLSSEGRETTGVVTAFVPTPDNDHIWEIEIEQDALVFSDGEVIDVAVYCVDIRMEHPIVPATALVRVDETRFDIFVLDRDDGPWGQRTVAVRRHSINPWPLDESADYVFLIDSEIDRPVILGIDTGDLYDGMEVRTDPDFVFDFDFVPPPRQSLQNDEPDNVQTDTGQDYDSEDRIRFPVKEGLSGTLRISDPLGFFIVDLAEGFMEIYPDVEIIVDSLPRDADFLDPTIYIDFANRLRVQLMSGVDAPDIICLLQTLDFIRAADSGLIIDLYPFWNNDPDIIQEDYFTNIIELYEHNGGLFAMPTSFLLSTYRINKRITEPLGIDVEAMNVISYLKLLDIFIRAQDEGVVEDDFKFMYGDMGPLAIIQPVLPRFFDQRTGVARFNTPEFVEILKKANRLPRNTTVFTSWMTVPLMTRFEEENDAFIMFENLAVPRMAILSQSTELTSQPIFTSCVDGSLIKVPNSLFAISSASEYPELAWEFIKYLIMESEKTTSHINLGRWDGDRWDGSIPINRNNFYKYMKTSMDLGFGFDIDIYEKLLSLIEIVNDYGSWPVLANELRLLDILTLYFDQGLITAEEAARQLQERAEIFFAE